MSLFLGKIHYWLFNKIVWFEGLEDEMVVFAQKQGLDMESLLKELDEKYGAKLPKKPLEEIIDTGNIHGWLQEKIHVAEGRIAAMTAYIIESNSEYMTGLEGIYKSQGKKAADEVKEANGDTDSAEEIYNYMNDYILDGMPCDRANEVVSSSTEAVEWVRTLCVHKNIWENAGVSVDCFYRLRDFWIQEFVKELNSGFEYVKENNEKMAIKRI